MNNVDEMEKKVINKRDNIFTHNKFEQYIDILNNMGIPRKFDYNNCIPTVFDNTEYQKINKFETKQYNNLYKDVLSYAKDKEINESKEIKVLVHPFYPIIRHANFLIQDPEYYEKYLKYEKDILKELNDPENNIILFESPDNFARFTYKFYDIGSVKKVIFTEHSTGKVLDENRLKSIKKYKNIEIIGCYGENCVKDVEEQLNEYNLKRNTDMILERAIKL